jgi:hypothetical protein
LYLHGNYPSCVRWQFPFWLPAVSSQIPQQTKEQQSELGDISSGPGSPLIDTAGLNCG